MSRLRQLLKKFRSTEHPVSAKFFHNWDAALDAESIVVSGKPPRRMATFASDQVIGQSVRSSEHFPEDAILHVTKFIRHKPGRKPIFVDIGANIGTHAIFALHNGFRRAICIEPESKNFMLLQINQILNGVEDRCQNFKVAISAREMIASLELSEDNHGDHRVRIESRDNTQMVYDENRRDVVDVSTIPLDELLSRNKIDVEQIGLVWIDTQGHEGYVLSAAKSLEQAKVPIVLEFWPYGLKRSGGFPLLRQFLSKHPVTYDLSRSLSNKTPLTLPEIDVMFDRMLAQETREVAHFIDLLVLSSGAS